MEEEKFGSSKFEHILKKAEDALLCEGASDAQKGFLEDIEKLLYGIELRQTELESENEDLRRSIAEYEAARRKGFVHYQSPIIGYCTLDKKGAILEANPSLSTFLRIDNSRLMHKDFTQFVTRECHEAFSGYLNRIFESKVKHRCRLTFVREDGGADDGVGMDVQMEGFSFAGGAHITLIDLTEKTQPWPSLNGQSPELCRRTSELGCICSICSFIDKETISMEDALQDTVNLLRRAMRNPDSVCARITLRDMVVTTEAFQATPFRFCSDITVQDQCVGKVEIFYTREGLKESMGCPIKEDREVVNIIAKRLGKLVLHKWSKEKLKESEERHRNFLQDFRGIAFKKTLDFKPIFFYGAVKAITGFNESAFIDGLLTWENLICQDDQYISKEQRACLNTIPEYSCDLEYRIVRQDGKIRWVHENLHNICDNSGRPLHVQGTIFDITERKLAEDALKDSEERFRLIAETSMDFIFQMDPGGIVTFCSAAVKRILGYESDEALGRHFSIFFPAPELPKVIDAFKKTLSGGRIKLLELNISHKNGESLFVEINEAPIINKGEVIGVQAILRDITERKLVEERLRASLKEKGLLLGEIHHRVKNNLQVISSLLDMSCRRTANQETRDVLIDAQTKIHAMALIHTQLYKSERYDQIDMPMHIQRLVANLSQVYANGTITVTPVVHTFDLYLPIDQAIACTLVLNELISNAFKHAFHQRGSGRIEVVMERAGRREICLRVRDDGVGISEGIDIEKAKSLGFTLIRNIVQRQLKGTVQCESEKGTEVSITFELPEERFYAQDHDR